MFGLHPIQLASSLTKSSNINKVKDSEKREEEDKENLKVSGLRKITKHNPMVRPLHL